VIDNEIEKAAAEVVRHFRSDHGPGLDGDPQELHNAIVDAITEAMKGPTAERDELRAILSEAVLSVSDLAQIRGRPRLDWTE
jgi:hypothetical protein